MNNFEYIFNCCSKKLIIVYLEGTALTGFELTPENAAHSKVWHCDGQATQLVRKESNFSDYMRNHK